MISGVVEPVYHVNNPEKVWGNSITAARAWGNRITAAPICEHEAFTNARDKIRYIVASVPRPIHYPKAFHGRESNQKCQRTWREARDGPIAVLGPFSNTMLFGD